jgi:dienelactone hydrolase
MQALGLDPLPPRTELNARVTGIIRKEGFRIEKIRLESRPGWLVTAHLYMPEGQGDGPFPVVLNPHGHWEFKKNQSWVQSRGISLALAGFAALIVDSPGFSWDDNDANERKAQGTHDDWFLCMGAPIQGLYTWDLMRCLDYLESRPDCDAKRVGITGCSGGGTATMYAFAADERISAAAPVCYIASYENSTTDGCLCNHVAGALKLGDRNDILAMRAPAPVMVIGASVDADFPLEGTKLAFQKLQKDYKGKARLVIEESNHDYNRRMREAMLAFFLEHLKGEPFREHFAELRPLTDGLDRPYPCWTEDPLSPELLVTSPEDRQTLTSRDILRRSLAEPYPEAYDVQSRLTRWTRYGQQPTFAAGAILAIHDASVENPKEPNSVAIPFSDFDQRKAIYLGIGLPELVAQILHGSLPGGPQGWESGSVLAADALTSMIASVKTLATAAGPQDPPKMMVAEGPASSMAALFFKLLRPEVQIEVSHHWASWMDVMGSGIREVVQPGARYLAFPSQNGTA